MEETKSKNWKSYFLEFLMLFLAVSLGFMADNYRENLSDKSKEKGYIISMIEDVEKDKLNILEVLKFNKRRSEHLDSLGTICMNYNPTEKNNLELYKYLPIILYKPDFIDPTELTMHQLKNAGGMRLIKNKEAINEIVLYDSKIKKIENQQIYYENYHHNSIDVGTKIFNLYKVRSYMYEKTDGYNPTSFQFISNDESLLSEFGNNVLMYKGIVVYYVILVKEMEKQADNLIQTLKREYRLK